MHGRELHDREEHKEEKINLEEQENSNDEEKTELIRAPEEDDDAQKDCLAKIRKEAATKLHAYGHRDRLALFSSFCFALLFVWLHFVSVFLWGLYEDRTKMNALSEQVNDLQDQMDAICAQMNINGACEKTAIEI
mmetsp:Transcript_40032/g.64077  ORF Transcript_40032/g.64077 Transcript_40032/m.64077 type:complete len:135 (+) Transcript_40032:232-636(+)